jgi:diketogulonate reductase-like aldo/keto reductase
MVNQIKVCPGQPQTDIVKFSKENKMVVEGYSPLGTGKIFLSEEMQNLSKKYNRSIAQICVRWSLERGVLPLPKSVHEERIVENSRIFDFELESSDSELIAGLTNLEIRPNRNPDEAPF